MVLQTYQIILGFYTVNKNLSESMGVNTLLRNYFEISFISLSKFTSLLILTIYYKNEISVILTIYYKNGI